MILLAALLLVMPAAATVEISETSEPWPCTLVDVGGPLVVNPHPRLRGRLGILRARQSHYLAPILLGFLFLFPFASAASISDLTFSNADVPNLSTGVGDLVAIDLNLPSSSHHFS